MEHKLKGIPEYKNGDMVNDLFVVRFKKPPRKTKTGKWFFELKLQDSKGEIMLKYWGSHDKEKTDRVYESIKEDSVIKIVKGKVSSYNQKLDFSVNEDTGKIIVLETGEFDPKEFIRYSKEDPEKLFSRIQELLNSIKDPDLKKIRDVFLNDNSFIEKFKTSPGAMYRHHGWMHGLMEHTWNVMDICNKVSDNFNLDRDLLLMGAFLHDIGKIQEFDVTLQIKVSDRGNLLGHLPIGLEMFVKKTSGLDISNLTRDKIMHMMISHHGKLEYGSPKPPMFPEAFVLHKIDDLDSGLAGMQDLIENANTEDNFVYNKNYGNIYLK